MTEIPREENLSENNKKKTVARISTYNFRSSRNGILEMTDKVIMEYNIDISIITETRLSGIYTRMFHEYHIVSTKTSFHSGGVALMYRDSKAWQM